MAPNVYAVNQRVRVSVEFKESGVLTDPTTITAKYRPQGGSVTTLLYGTDIDLQRDSVGKYHTELLATAAGSWWYRFEGTGLCAAAEEAEFFVRQSQF